MNIGQPLLRLDTAAKEHLEILEACRKRDAETAVDLLAKHIEISREHTLGVRPMARFAEGQTIRTGGAPLPARKSGARRKQ